MDEDPPPIMQLLFQLRDRVLKRERPASPELTMLQSVLGQSFAQDTLPALVGQRPQVGATDDIALILEASKRLGRPAAGRTTKDGKKVTVFAPGFKGDSAGERRVAEGVLSHEFGHVLDQTAGGEAILGRKVKPEEFAELFSSALNEVRTSGLWTALAGGDASGHWSMIEEKEKEQPGLTSLVNFILANPMYADHPLRKVQKK